LALEIETSREGHVGLIEICRPPHNYFTIKLIREIGDALKAFDADKDIRAVVLASRGSSFCAGADLKESGDFGGADVNERFGALYDAGTELMRTKKPIVGAIAGAAVGGGVGLALVADFRVASPGSRFTVNFVKLGIHPGFGLTVTLPRLIGQQKAAELFLTGKRIGGEEAHAIGLVDRLVPDGQVREAAFALANEIAVNAPLAIMSIRETLRLGTADAARERMDRERTEQVRLRVTDDAEEGIRAVTERRDGNFTAS
jgi:enoyl-CoA hydratase/carnithine racemase